jgi:tetratricopeptide (TPR) repeat protein
MKHKQQRNAGAGVRKPRPVSTKRSVKPPALTLRDVPFTELVTRAPELANARQEFAGKSPNERRRAAEWAYDSGVAHDLFSSALRAAGVDTEAGPGFDSDVAALAIDPLFAPALLTVGALECQYGRHEAAMEIFLTLTTLPQNEPDLAEIIDKAGSFLLDEDDAKNAARLFRAATQAYPAVGEHWSSLSYCLGKLGELREAVATARQALALHADDPHVLNDLGWTLVLADHHEEARAVLERAAALAPAGYDLPRNNLKELESRVSGTAMPRREDGVPGF